MTSQVTKHGLTSAEAAERMLEYGPNKLPEGTRNAFLVYLGCAHAASPDVRGRRIPLRCRAVRSGH